MKKVLFVCTGNTCRSPMAEGIFNKLATEYGIDAVAESAGLNTKNDLPVSENAVKACAEIGIDIRGHKSKNFDDCNPDDYVTDENAIIVAADAAADRMTAIFTKLIETL